MSCFPRALLLVCGLLLANGHLLAQTESATDGPETTGAAKNAAANSVDAERLATVDKVLTNLAKTLAAEKVAGIEGILHPTAEWVDDTGRVFVGLEEIRRALVELAGAYPGLQVEFRTELARPLGDDLLVADGVRRSGTRTEPLAASGRFTATFTKDSQGDWRLLSLREFTDAATVAPGEQLKALDWMIGEWIDEGPDSKIRLSCRRSEDGMYLLRDFTVSSSEKILVRSSQRIAWDPLEKRIRSWNFDSDGGFGDGLWTQDGNRWIVRTTSTLTDGRTASAVHVLTPDGKDRVRWQSSLRIVGDTLEPDLEAVMVRAPPKAEASKE